MRIPLFLFLLITLPAVAAEKSMRSCRILFLDGPSEAPQKLHLFDGTNSQEVELPRMNFPPVYDVPAATTSLALLPSAPPAPTGGNRPPSPKAHPRSASRRTSRIFISSFPAIRPTASPRSPCRSSVRTSPNSSAARCSGITSPAARSGLTQTPRPTELPPDPRRTRRRIGKLPREHPFPPTRQAAPRAALRDNLDA